jgi:hypothetical protein
MSVDKRDIATSEETLLANQNALSKEFLDTLVKYSLKRLYTHSGIKYNFEKGIRGIMIEDMIQQTLEGLIKDGGRNWYKDKFDDIKLQIISSLDSVISNTVSTHLDKDNKTFEIFENEEVEFTDDEEYNSILEVCHEELKRLDSSDEEILLFEPYIIQGMKRQDLSDLFGISLNELTNIKKRLDRKLPLLKAKLKELGYEK